MDVTTQAPEAEAPVASTEAPAPVKAVRKAAPKAKPAVKAQAKAAPAKKARTTIPEGMTRSRGLLIPKATGKCSFTGAKGQCANPGRWTVQPENALSCTNHKQAGKRTLFAPVKAKRSAPKAKASAATAS